MAARRIRPYRQGRLDGLCGTYALVNALRLLCPRLNEDACEAAFCALIRARTRQTASPLAIISHGLSRRELLQLLSPWRRFVRKQLGIRLTVSGSRCRRSRAWVASGKAWVGYSTARASPSSGWMGSSGTGRWPTPPLSAPCG